MLKNKIKYEKIDEFKKNGILSNVLELRNIVIYIITYVISTINLGQSLSLFSISITAACFSTEVPAIGVITAALLGNYIGFGIQGVLNYILTVILFLVTLLIVRPRYNEENRNEKIKLAKNIIISTMIIGILKIFSNESFLVNIFFSVMCSMVIYVFYKIYTSSLVVIENIGIKKVFSVEEVISASLLLGIAITTLNGVSILGFSVVNILNFFIIMALGWQNGMLVGTTTGVTIGITTGIITNCPSELVVIYSIAGLVSGVLNRFGKVGVTFAIIAGLISVVYFSDGNINKYIIVEEILIAAIGVLLIPGNAKIRVEDLFGNRNMLPIFPNRALNRSNNTIEKLNAVSKTVQEMADNYKANVNDETYEENKRLFVSELLNGMDSLKDNMLYDDFNNPEGKIIDKTFDVINNKQVIEKEDLIKILEDCNNYIIGFDSTNTNKVIEDNIRQILHVINYSYKISKVNFVMDKKIENNKKSMKNQLEGLSKAITNIASEIKDDIVQEKKFLKEQEELISLLKQKNILVDNVYIKQEKNRRKVVDIYFNNGFINTDIQKIQDILSNIFKEKFILLNKNARQELSILTYVPEDKFKVEIGISSTVKNGSPVSGDSTLNIRLKDGKTLVAISDGMGTGPEARKSSQIAIKMLERLLQTGFDKDVSVELINAAIRNESEEIFATLDIAILDLYAGKIEFIKNGACPSYIKNKRKIQLQKSLELPAGAMDNINLTVSDKDFVDNEILIMCSDGIIESNTEYKNRELWIKYLLEDLETEDAKRISDLLLNESIDNNFGMPKDDMTVIACKFIKI